MLHSKRLCHHFVKPRWHITSVLSLSTLMACAPAMNWRDVRPAGAGVSVELPCKPSVYARELQLHEMKTEWTITACSAGGQTWALASGELKDPANVAPTLQFLVGAAKANVDAVALESSPWSPRGATPSAYALRVRMRGALPDGRLVAQELAVFARGTRVFQASVVGVEAAPEDLDVFFASLRVL